MRISHAPESYDCPFCRLQGGVVNENNQLADVVVREELVHARIAPKWWPANPGAVLVIPNAHRENLYDLPVDVGHAVWDLTQRVAVAMRQAYGCEGISTRQHNEPAGNQDVWHLHVHVLPRYSGDDLYRRHWDARWVTPVEREVYADRLRAALAG